MPVQRIESNPRMSAAVVHADLVFLAGQVPDDRSLDAAGQSREVLAKIDWLPAGCAPARATVQARLASPEVLVEIMVIAARA